MRHCLKSFSYINSFDPHDHESSTVMILSLLIRKLKHMETQIFIPLEAIESDSMVADGVQNFAFNHYALGKYG